MSDEEQAVPPAVVSRTKTPSKKEIEDALATLRAALDNGTVGEAEEERPVEQHVPVHAIGPGAMATGHGLAGGGRKRTGPKAYEAFIDALRERVGQEIWDGITVQEQATWMKLEGRLSRERLYIAKTLTVVSRVESTLPPEAVAGSTQPDKVNGSINSWVPANEESCAEAIRLIATLDAPLLAAGRR